MMTAGQRQKLIYWPWLSLPLVLFSYLIFWNSLPDPMGVHIGLNGKTNGWMSREASLGVSMAGLFVMLALSTWSIRHRQYACNALLIRHCLATCVLTGILIFTVWRNL